MSINLRYPRSFAKLLTLAFVLVALPLLIGLVSNAFTIRRLAVHSQQAVYSAVHVTQVSRSLQEEVSSLERLARQYLILKDPALGETYQRVHQGFIETGKRLEAQPLTEIQTSELGRLLSEEQKLFTSVSAGRQVDVVAGFDVLAGLSRSLLDHSSEGIEQELGSLLTLAGEAETVVYSQLLALVAVAVFLVLGFGYLLARPIAELGQGIRGLGDGNFERKIVVSGPEDLEQLGRQLEWLRSRLLQLEEQKSRFLRHVSHELKTPLTALLEGANLLAEQVVGPLTGQQEEIVRILQENAGQLRHLIEDLLHYSAAEFQQASLKLQIIAPRELVAYAAEKQRLAMSAKSLALQVEVAEFELLADAERLRVLLDNLLSNAVKFSPPGGSIALTWKLEAGLAVLEIADEGPGVAVEDRERIFDPFYQGGTRGTASVEGSGLGLSIAREHALAHGGTIELVAGQRCRFRVALPVDRAAVARS